MPNPTKPAASTDLISSPLFGRPTAAHVVRAYNSEADRDADNAAGVVEAGQVAVIGTQHTVRYTSAWHRMPIGAAVNQVTAAGDGLIPIGYWVPVGAAVWVSQPHAGAAMIVMASMAGLEVPEITGTPYLILGVRLSGLEGWYEVARSSAVAFWNKSGSMNGTRAITGAPPGAVYVETGLYVTEAVALRAGKASFSVVAIAA